MLKRVIAYKKKENKKNQQKRYFHTPKNRQMFTPLASIEL